jgi:hypothetical protein
MTTKWGKQMPNYRVEGTSGGSDQRIIEARNEVDAIKEYLYQAHGFGGLLREYDKDSDPRGIYENHQDKRRWSHVTISISPAFGLCTFEGCDAGDDYEEFDDGLCYDHQPDLEDEDDDE